MENQNLLEVAKNACNPETKTDYQTILSAVQAYVDTLDTTEEKNQTQWLELANTLGCDKTLRKKLVKDIKLPKFVSSVGDPVIKGTLIYGNYGDLKDIHAAEFASPLSETITFGRMILKECDFIKFIFTTNPKGGFFVDHGHYSGKNNEYLKNSHALQNALLSAAKAPEDE